MNTIAFLNQKGGAGKSASSIAIAEYLAELGKKVLIIDLDPQGSVSTRLGKINKLVYIDSLWRNITIDSQETGLLLEDILLDTTGSVDVHDVIQHTKHENLDLIPTYLTLSIAESKLRDDAIYPQQFRLKNHLENVQDEYDYCILDCSPSISIININGLAIADKVYIPMTPDADAIAGAATIRNIIRTVATYNPKLELGGLFFIKWSDNSAICREVNELIKRYVPDLMLPFNIPNSRYLERNTFTDGANLPANSRPGIVYREFAEYIIKSFEA